MNIHRPASNLHRKGIEHAQLLRSWTFKVESSKFVPPSRVETKYAVHSIFSNLTRCCLSKKIWNPHGNSLNIQRTSKLDVRSWTFEVGRSKLDVRSWTCGMFEMWEVKTPWTERYTHANFSEIEIERSDEHTAACPTTAIQVAPNAPAANFSGCAGTGASRLHTSA